MDGRTPGYGGATPAAMGYGGATPAAMGYGGATPAAMGYGGATPAAMGYGGATPAAGATPGALGRGGRTPGLSGSRTPAWRPGTPGPDIDVGVLALPGKQTETDLPFPETINSWRIPM